MRNKHEFKTDTKILFFQLGIMRTNFHDRTFIRSLLVSANKAWIHPRNYKLLIPPPSLLLFC